jgi:hypothetical protein
MGRCCRRYSGRGLPAGNGEWSISIPDSVSRQRHAYRYGVTDFDQDASADQFEHANCDTDALRYPHTQRYADAHAIARAVRYCDSNADAQAKSDAYRYTNFITNGDPYSVADTQLDLDTDHYPDSLGHVYADG